MSALVLVGMAVASIVVLIVLIAQLRLNPFITILAVSLLLGLAAGMPSGKVVASFENGAGHALGHIAIIIALGTMLGKMLAESGGAERVANTLIGWFGPRQIHWAMMLIGLIVGLPVFFEVGFVLLIPVAFNVAEKTGQPLLVVAMPLIAGLSVAHGLLPPHPATMLAVQAFHADVGRTILYGLLVGVPAAIAAGPLYGRFIGARGRCSRGKIRWRRSSWRMRRGRELPPFGVTMLTILLPVILMLVGSWAGLVAAKGSVLNQVLGFLGNTDIALLLATILSFVTLGTARGFSRDDILRFSNESLAPTAVIMLLIGAGGGFGRILIDSGISNAIVGFTNGAHIPLLLLAWLLAAVVRLAVGSSTVALTTSAGIVAPIIAHTPGASPELLVLATGAGSLIFSHVNDAGFWLVKQYLNMSVGQTMKSWSVVETIISVCGLVLTLGLSAAGI
jgi:gluconate:H+ symporter, GntP family